MTYRFVTIGVFLFLLVSQPSCRTIPHSKDYPGLNELLKMRLANLDIPEVCVEDAVGTLSSVEGFPSFNYVIDARQGDQKVTLKGKDVTIADALDSISEQTGLEWTILHGAIFIGTRKSVKALEKIPAISPGDSLKMQYRLNNRLEYHGYFFGIYDLDLASAVSYLGRKSRSRLQVKLKPKAEKLKQVEIYRFMFDFYYASDKLRAKDYLWWIGVLWDVKPYIDGDTVKFNTEKNSPPEIIEVKLRGQ